MRSQTISIQMMLTAAMILFGTQSAIAQDFDQLSTTEIKEKWGRVILCQRIYTLSEVKPRLYDFDYEQCDSASQLMTEIVANYPATEQALLKTQAERHARALSFNTSEPYHSVHACRQYCGKLAKMRDQRND